MSEPKQITSVEPAPAAAQDFDFEAFWIEHGRTVKLILLVLVALVVTWGGYELNKTRRTEGSTAALASASTVDELRKVINDWSGTPAAATAQLVLAEKLREEKKYDEAEKVLQTFIKEQPKHQLISGALSSLAVTQESAGKTEQALATYQQLVTSHKTSPHADPALLAQARIFKSQKRDDEAVKILNILDPVDPQAPRGPWSWEAKRLRKDLKPTVPDVEAVSSAPVKVDPTVTEIKVETPPAAAPETPAPATPTSSDSSATPAPATTPAAEPQPQTVSTPPLSVDTMPEDAKKDSKPETKDAKPDAAKSKKPADKKTTGKEKKN